jgi:hypothetical protein
VTDLPDQLAARDQLAALIRDGGTSSAIADRILAAGWRPPHGALCHPRRELFARGLCEPCYEHHRRNATLQQFPRSKRPTADFATDYDELRAQGLSRIQIAWRLGMRRNSVDAAYRRAVLRGVLTPDRPVLGAYVVAADGRGRTRGTSGALTPNRRTAV